MINTANNQEQNPLFDLLEADLLANEVDNKTLGSLASVCSRTKELTSLELESRKEGYHTLLVWKRLVSRLETTGQDLELPPCFHASDKTPIKVEEAFLAWVHAKNVEITALQLENLRLPQVPSVIFQFREISQINLANNGLTELPPEIGLLERLLILNVSNNRLTSLPDTILRHQRLSQLHLQSNAFTALPREIEFLPNLNCIWAQDNPLDLTSVALIDRLEQRFQGYHSQWYIKILIARFVSNWGF